MLHKPLEFLYERFTALHRGPSPRAARRRHDQLAAATFPDGTLPDVDDVKLIAANLFAAGGETTARLLATMVRFLGERPELQQRLRDDRELIPNFVEETLRLETPLHTQFRLARRNTTVGGIDFPAGTTMMMLNGAANHDPRQFDDPDELRLDRVNGRKHLGFGFGIHTCAGAPLARRKRASACERILDRMDDITISEAAHGPAGAASLRVLAHLPAPWRRAAASRVHADRRRGRAERAVTAVVHEHRPELRGAVSVHDEQFRAELRAWLAEHTPPTIELATTPEEADVMRAWQRTLHDGRWVGIHWPVEYGGRGASPAQTAIYNEELARAGAPPLLGRVGISLVGPTLMPHGTEEQRRRWMPRILDGDDVWCQLFSEPDAGSDLAGLTTRADKHDDVYVVNGQKVWSSYARFANWGIALVRTDRSATNHRGISMLAIPMTATGVDVRPLRQMTGESEFNEVFFDNVEIPAELPHRSRARGLAGREHDARQRTRRFVHLAASRCCTSSRWSTSPRRARGGAASPTRIVRQRLAQSWIEVEIFRLHNARTLARLARGEELGAESSLVKLFWANMSQRLLRHRGRRAGARRARCPAPRARSTAALVARPARAAQRRSWGDERDPAQHHRRAPARAAARTEAAMIAGVDVLDLIDPERYARRGYPHDDVDAAPRPRHPSRTSHPRAGSRSGRSRSTPTSWRSRSSRCASPARRGSRCSERAS